MRPLRRLAQAAGIVVAMYLAASVVLPLVPGPVSAVPQGSGLRLGLAAGPIHNDFIVPLTPEVRARFGFAIPAGVRVDDATEEWLLIGHGGRAFYTTVGTYADLTAGAVWRGVTGDRSVLRLEVLGPIRADAPVDWLEIGPEQMTAFLDAVLDGAAPGGVPEALPGPGLSEGDVFFASAGRSDIVRTCNSWAGEMLRAAGVRFGLWTPATWSVRLSLWRFAD